MEDIIENEEVDTDTVKPEELEKIFSTKFSLLTEQAVSKSYINKLSCKNSQIVLGLSDNSIEIYELTNTSLSKVCRLSGHQQALTEVVVSPKEDHLVYSCGNDGLVKLWDTRTSGSCVQEYKGDAEEVTKPYECMDVSCTGRVLCAGSQLVEDDAYLVFWDQRQPAPLGGYWNTHTDDITQVKFHEEKPGLLVSGASDSLINVFDVREATEDDALQYSLGAADAVEALHWAGGARLACVTQGGAAQLFDAAAGDLLRTYSREKIAKAIKRSRGDECYVAGAFRDAAGAPALLAGSLAPGGVLRTVLMTDKKLQPCADLKGNRQTVRCCCYLDDRDLLVTAGEAGVVSVWRGPGADEAQVGADEAQVGADEAQVGADEAQVGADEAQMGADEAPVGAERAQVGAGRTQVGAVGSKLADALRSVHVRHRPY